LVVVAIICRGGLLGSEGRGRNGSWGQCRFVELLGERISFDPSQQAGRIPGCNPEGRDVAGDDAAGTDDCAVADIDPRQQDGVSSDPHIFSDRDRLSKLGAAGSVSEVRVFRVGAAEDGDVGSDQGPGSDGYRTGVEGGEVEVDEDAWADFEVGAIVYVDGGVDPRFLGKELLVLVLVLVCFLGRRQRGGWKGLLVGHDAMGLAVNLGRFKQPPPLLQCTFTHTLSRALLSVALTGHPGRC
jgi:hypothetical protein